jgi:hypothetical protein
LVADQVVVRPFEGAQSNDVRDVSAGEWTLLTGFKAGESYYVDVVHGTEPERLRVTATPLCAGALPCLGTGCAKCGSDSAWGNCAKSAAEAQYKGLGDSPPPRLDDGPACFQLSKPVAQLKYVDLSAAGTSVQGDKTLRKMPDRMFLHAEPASSRMAALALRDSARVGGLVLLGTECFSAARADAVLYEPGAADPASAQRRACETYFDTWSCLIPGWPRKSPFWVFFYAADEVRLLRAPAWRCGQLGSAKMQLIESDRKRACAEELESSSDDDILLTDLVLFR